MSLGLKLSVRFSARMAKELRARAESKGIPVGEYLRALIETDLRKGGAADTLAPLNTEITLVTGMMLREFLNQSLGREAARRLEDWANGRALGIIREELREGVAEP